MVAEMQPLQLVKGVWLSRLLGELLGKEASWCSSLVVASLWQWNGEKHTSYGLLAKSIFGGYSFSPIR